MGIAYELGGSVTSTPPAAAPAATAAAAWPAAPVMPAPVSLCENSDSRSVPSGPPPAPPPLPPPPMRLWWYASAAPAAAASAFFRRFTISFSRASFPSVFWQSVQRQWADVQYTAAWKHSQYFLRQWDLRQLHPDVEERRVWYGREEGEGPPVPGCCREWRGVLLSPVEPGGPPPALEAGVPTSDPLRGVDDPGAGELAPPLWPPAMDRAAASAPAMARALGRNACGFLSKVVRIASVLNLTCSSLSPLLAQSTQLHDGAQFMLLAKHSQYNLRQCDLLQLHCFVRSI
mmetsp:Transcript_314/g.899  ORF Transcript_314/g.899 Transcript_314/m.899 type:complete len:288 (-) Transcript_314:1984-2847(-)